MTAFSRRIRRVALGTLALATATLQPAVASAQEIRQFYDVSVSGLRVASMELAVNLQGASYTVRGQVNGNGLIGALFSFGVGGVARGRILADGSLRPVSYDGYRQDGGDRYETYIRYEGPRVREARLDPERRPRTYDIEPTEQTGTLDPVSASFWVLADRPAGASCKRSVEIYDGRRRSRLTVFERGEGEDRFVCSGVYSRVAGYSKRQMEEKVDFPFRIHYREINGVMQVMRIETDSVIGAAVARRR